MPLFNTAIAILSVATFFAGAATADLEEQRNVRSRNLSGRYPCTFYNSPNQGGTRYRIDTYKDFDWSHFIPVLPSNMNDKFDSYDVADGYTLEVCKNTWYGGGCTSVGSGKGNLPSAYRNKVSSYKCNYEGTSWATPQPCLFFNKNNYAGGMCPFGDSKFTGSQDIAMIAGTIDNSFNSYQLAPNYELTVCKGQYFESGCLFVGGGSGNLPSAWRNNVSSFKCHKKGVPVVETPIGLDIDGSGAVERIQGDFFLDITGDGDIEHKHEWFAPTEGILIDYALAERDGIVTPGHFAKATAAKSQEAVVARELVQGAGAITGKHLFGDMGTLFTDGFQKLATKDKDGNHSVEGEELNGLAVWVDSNSNAKVDMGELATIESYGIVSFSTVHSDLVSSAELADGSTMVVADLLFAR